VLTEQEDTEARIAEVVAEGICIAVTRWAENPRARGGEASRLRKESLQRLRKASLSSFDAA